MTMEKKEEGEEKKKTEILKAEKLDRI